MSNGMTLVDIFGNISVFLLFAWFCSAVLENKNPVFSTVVGVIMYGIVLPAISVNPAVISAVHSTVRYALIMLSFWLYTAMAFKGGIKEKILAYVIGYSIINASQMVVSAMMSILNIAIIDNMEWLMAGSCALAYGIMFVVSRIWNSISLVLSQTRFATFFLLPVCQFALIALTVFVMGKSDSFNYFLEQGDYRWVPVCVSGVFLLSLIADGMVLDGVVKMADTIKEQERLRTIELENTLTYDYVKSVESDITEMRKFRHDYLNMLTAVQLTIESGSEGHDEEALKIVREMTREISGITGKHYCECIIVNSILARAERQLTGQSIRCDLRAEVPEKLEVSELDLCRVMTNLFDNARESCMRMPDGTDRWVRSNIRVQEGYLYITVHNSCTDDDFSTETTRKKDTKQHGLGLKIIRELAAKHGGDLLMNLKPGAVEITVTLRWGD